MPIRRGVHTSFARVAFVLVIFGAIELVIGYAWLVMNGVENCNPDNTLPRWECNSTLQAALGVAFFVLPVVAFVLTRQAARTPH